MTLKRYVIERDIVGIGAMSSEELCGASKTSNQALAQLAPRIQWEHSYVADDKTFCVYLADDDALIAEHAERSGFPASVVTRVKRMIDPVTAEG